MWFSTSERLKNRLFSETGQPWRSRHLFVLAFIPLDFKTKRKSEFDTKYMNEEFELAYNLARSGYKWSKYPPGFEPEKSKPTTAKQVR